MLPEVQRNTSVHMLIYITATLTLKPVYVDECCKKISKYELHRMPALLLLIFS